MKHPARRGASKRGEKTSSHRPPRNTVKQSLAEARAASERADKHIKRIGEIRF